MKRILALALVVFIALAILVSCDDNDSGNGNKGGSTNAGVSSNIYTDTEIAVSSGESYTSSNGSIAGKWQNESGMIYEFRSNGVLLVSYGGETGSGTYSIDGNRINVNMTFMGKTMDDSDEFRIEGNNFYVIHSNGSEEFVMTRID